MKMESLLNAFCMLLILSGCAPTTDTFYAPTASEGDIGGYGDHYAPKDLHLTRGNNVRITVDGGMFIDQPEKNNRIFIDIRVPADEVLEVPISDIKVTAPDSAVKATLTGYIYRLHATDKLSGNETELKGDRYPGETAVDYTLYETFDGPKPDVFYVELPSMRVGDKSYLPLRIQFKKSNGWWIQTYM